MQKDLMKTVNAYFRERINRCGPVPAGVDWNSEAAQVSRFAALCRILPPRQGFSLNDLGCGYGHLAAYLAENQPGCHRYAGYDLSAEMIRAAENCAYELPVVRFQVIDGPGEMSPADYTVASGIFNVKFDYPESRWLAYVLETLDAMDQKSRAGFAFNMLTRYADPEYMRDDLFYADPCFMFDYCKRNYSRHVALIHDYGLYDFTIQVSKHFPEAEK